MPKSVKSNQTILDAAVARQYPGRNVYVTKSFKEVAPKGHVKVLELKLKFDVGVRSDAAHAAARIARARLPPAQTNAHSNWQRPTIRKAAYEIFKRIVPFPPRSHVATALVTVQTSVQLQAAAHEYSTNANAGNRNQHGVHASLQARIGASLAPSLQRPHQSSANARPTNNNLRTRITAAGPTRGSASGQAGRPATVRDGAVRARPYPPPQLRSAGLRNCRDHRADYAPFATAAPIIPASFENLHGTVTRPHPANLGYSHSPSVYGHHNPSNYSLQAASLPPVTLQPALQQPIVGAFPGNHTNGLGAQPTSMGVSYASASDLMALGRQFMHDRQPGYYSPSTPIPRSFVATPFTSFGSASTTISDDFDKEFGLDFEFAFIKDVPLFANQTQSTQPSAPQLGSQSWLEQVQAEMTLY